MSEKSAAVVDRARSMIVEIDDPVELQKQLKEMLEAEFPVAAPIFKVGERIRAHEFLQRFRTRYCKNSEPVFHTWPVIVNFDELGELTVTFVGTRISPSPVPSPVEGEGI